MIRRCRDPLDCETVGGFRLFGGCDEQGVMRRERTGDGLLYPGLAKAKRKQYERHRHTMEVTQAFAAA